MGILAGYTFLSLASHALMLILIAFAPVMEEDTFSGA